jgi:selenocysteine lyase/cysteine desulfurase
VSAATLELLAALKALLEWYAGLPEPGLVPHSMELSARLREARTAIAKVEGGAS